jgi:hypothetical protein
MRNPLGIHSLELVAGLTFLVPIFLYTVDYACVLYGGMMNNNLCAAAARAAAAGPPTGLAVWGSGTSPKSRAASVIANASKAGSMVCVKQTVRIWETVNPPQPSPTFGGPVFGSISVKTRCDVYPPFSLPFVPSDVVMYTNQTFPWTWVMPAAPTGTMPLLVKSATIGTNGTGTTLDAWTHDIGQPIADSDP